MFLLRFPFALVLAGLVSACAGAGYPPESTSALPTGLQSAAPSAAATDQSLATKSALAQPPAAVTERPALGASTGQQNWVSTYPYGTAQTAAATSTPSVAGAGSAGGGNQAASAEPTKAAEPGAKIIVIEEGGAAPTLPYGSGWTNPTKTADQRQADYEACYAYARSQVEHDIRIESDVASAFDDPDKGLGFIALTRRMNAFEHKQRRVNLVDNCLEKKGYAGG